MKQLEVTRTVSDNWYFVLPGLLFALQALYTFNSLNQIRYEELAESVRNPYWMAHGFMYDGTSSNVGWYGLLALVFKYAGFHLFMGKFVRLFIHLLSCFCLAAVLRRYLGAKTALIPLLAIGLSPTLLYFNTIQTTYGIDLQFLPVSLYFLALMRFDDKTPDLLVQGLYWSLAMLASLCYPTYVLLLPALGALYLYRLTAAAPTRTSVVRHLAIGAISFLLPLLVVGLYIKNKESLISDPMTHTGLFRGAGAFSFESRVPAQNLYALWKNLFLESDGYQFELAHVEFAMVLPAVALLVVAYLTYRLWLEGTFRFFIIVAAGSLLLAVIVISLTSPSPSPGPRRYTPVLAGLYTLFGFAWRYAASRKPQLGFLLLLGLIPLHHIIAYPGNLSHLKDLSIYRDREWLSRADTPMKSLSLLVDQAQRQELNLVCPDQKSRLGECRYSEIYAAVAGSCFWNRLACHPINGYDGKSERFIPLSIGLWHNYYLDH